MISVRSGENAATTTATAYGMSPDDSAREDLASAVGPDRFDQHVGLREQDVTVEVHERDRHRQEQPGVDRRCEVLAVAFAQVSGDQVRAERKHADPQQQQQVQHQDRVIRAPEPADHRVMVDPDDPDRDERSDVRGICRPLVRQLVAERVARAGRWNLDVQNQQRDRHRDHPVGEGLEPVRAHAPGFAAPPDAPVGAVPQPISRSAAVTSARCDSSRQTAAIAPPEPV